MTVENHEYFVCTQCGDRHRWRREEVGRKIICRCRNVMEIPPAPQLMMPAGTPVGPAATESPAAIASPAAPAPTAQPGFQATSFPQLGEFPQSAPLPAGVHAVPPNGRSSAGVGVACPACGNVIDSDDNFCSRCGYSLRRMRRRLAAGPIPRPYEATRPRVRDLFTGPRHSTEHNGGQTPDNALVVEPPDSEDAIDALADSDTGSTLIDWIVPGVLTAIGIIIMVILRAGGEHPGRQGAVGASIEILFALAVGVIIAVAAVLGVVRLLDVEVETIGSGILKTAAICVTPLALWYLIAHLCDETIQGYVLGAIVGFVVAVALAHCLFRLDLGGTLSLALVIFIVGWVVYFFIGALLSLHAWSGFEPAQNVEHPTVSVAAPDESPTTQP